MRVDACINMQVEHEAEPEVPEPFEFSSADKGPSAPHPKRNRDPLRAVSAHQARMSMVAAPTCYLDGARSLHVRCTFTFTFVCKCASDRCGRERR